MPGHGVRERQRLDREPEPLELRAQPLQPVQLVTHLAGALELQRLAVREHARAQRLHRPIAAAIKECARDAELRGVRALGDGRDTWSQALPDLVPDASRRTRRCNHRQLGLIAEVHAHVVAAVAQAEQVAQLAQRISHARCAEVGPEVRAPLVARCITRDRELGRESGRHAHEAVVPCIALHHPVVPRPQLLDQPQFAQQGRELAGLVFPLDARRTPQDACALVMRPLGAEVTHEARAQLLRLADVQHRAFTTQEAVGARSVLRARLHQLTQCIEVGHRLPLALSRPRGGWSVAGVVQHHVLRHVQRDVLRHVQRDVHVHVHVRGRQCRRCGGLRRLQFGQRDGPFHAQSLVAPSTCGRCRTEQREQVPLPDRLGLHRWQRQQNTVVRPSIALLSTSGVAQRPHGAPPRP